MTQGVNTGGSIIYNLYLYLMDHVFLFRSKCWAVWVYAAFIHYVGDFRIKLLYCIWYMCSLFEYLIIYHLWFGFVWVLICVALSLVLKIFIWFTIFYLKYVTTDDVQTAELISNQPDFNLLWSDQWKRHFSGTISYYMT